jgi:alkane 1-monooxygenase
LGEIALLISLENHFLPYHNLGHHRNVATPEDPATARLNEPVYTFWIRSQFGSYWQAWQFEMNKQRRMKRNPFSLRNRMVGYTIAQIGLISSIFFAFGWKTMLAFVAAAIIGKLHLETVNYIEHYGLTRKVKPDGKYERVMPWHSWNSDHVLGRSIMLELSRHSDHHYKASKHYQILDSFNESPQMPTGYPGMMIFSLFSPVWFWYMNKRIDKMKGKSN